MVFVATVSSAEMIALANIMGFTILGLKPNVSGKLAIISSIISGKHD